MHNKYTKKNIEASIRFSIALRATQLIYAFFMYKSLRRYWPLERIRLLVIC